MGIKDLFVENEEKKFQKAQASMMDQENRRQNMRLTNEQLQMIRLMDEKNDSTLVNVTLDNTPIIQQIEMMLKGEAIRVNENNQIDTVQIAPPIMNKEGVQNVLQTLVLGSNKNTVLARLTDDDIRKQAFIKHKNLTLLLAANRKRFELETSKRTSVLWDLSITNFASMSRSAAGEEAIQVYGHTKKIEHQSFVENENKKKGGIFS
jgi:hypothetical protein